MDLVVHEGDLPRTNQPHQRDTRPCHASPTTDHHNNSSNSSNSNTLTVAVTVGATAISMRMGKPGGRRFCRRGAVSGGRRGDACLDEVLEALYEGVVRRDQRQQCLNLHSKSPLSQRRRRRGAACVG